MNTEQKKIAPEAGTPEAKNRKTISINSILKNSREVKVLIKKPGELPQVIFAGDIPPDFLSRKLRCEPLDKDKLTLVYDPKSREQMNIAYAGTTYRGIVLAVSGGFRRLFEMSENSKDHAFVWLMRHRV